MLDKRCFALLELINQECQNSGYKVFSIEDLILSMPSVFGMDAVGISQCISTLSDHEYISVKYQDDVEVCLCPLTKGRIAFENKFDEQIEKINCSKKYFLYSFLGAFLGGIITAVIIFIITVFIGGGNA